MLFYNFILLLNIRSKRFYDNTYIIEILYSSIKDEFAKVHILDTNLQVIVFFQYNNKISKN